MSRYRSSANWNDLPPQPVIAARLGATAPTLATFVTDTEQYTFDATNDYIIGSTEVLHGYEEGTNIEMHAHFVTNGTNTDNRGVKYQLKYVVCKVGVAASAQVTASAEYTIPANTPDRTHFILDLGDITGTGIGIGAYIVWRFERITAAGTAPTGDPFVLAVGFHAKNDSSGSITEYTK